MVRLVFVLGIVNWMWRILRPRPLVDPDRARRAGLKHANQLQADHLEQRQERHDHVATCGDVLEQVLEAARANAYGSTAALAGRRTSGIGNWLNLAGGAGLIAAILWAWF